MKKYYKTRIKNETFNIILFNYFNIFIPHSSNSHEIKEDKIEKIIKIF